MSAASGAAVASVTGRSGGTGMVGASMPAGTDGRRGRFVRGAPAVTASGSLAPRPGIMPCNLPLSIENVEVPVVVPSGSGFNVAWAIMMRGCGSPQLRTPRSISSWPRRIVKLLGQRSEPVAAPVADRYGKAGPRRPSW